MPPATEVIARALIVVDDHVVLARQVGRAWSFLPGGHVDPGEPVVAALGRELAEELDVTIAAAEPIGVVEHAYQENGPRHELNMIFSVQISQPHGDLRSRENHLEIHLVPLADLPAVDLRPARLKDALAQWITTGAPFYRLLHTALVP
ncbi:hypothetical protein LI90_4274 [Carbonactinospora thermoautotrophica]|uniref:Nudix hydrolase domain-containing protein n=1 Tax=Carbonactinospora thermoautotrophica TaxID=1469144 RepID=A0A132MZH8_9ACTN|nr:NUDIX domain-containing protein [Carbonactinospora thermoautotrophica]KWX03223.1 hypothetical protein LI90_4274 [Carbonactinospora thermoautotrophica]